MPLPCIWSVCISTNSVSHTLTLSRLFRHEYRRRSRSAEPQYVEPKAVRILEDNADICSLDRGRARPIYQGFQTATCSLVCLHGINLVPKGHNVVLLFSHDNWYLAQRVRQISLYHFCCLLCRCLSYSMVLSHDAVDFANAILDYFWMFSIST